MSKASPSAKRPGPDVTIPAVSKALTIAVAGSPKKHSYDVDFDDVLKLRAFMAAKRGILEDVEALPDDANEATQMEFIEKTATRIVEAVEMILGEGSYDEIFEGRRSLFGGLALLVEIEKYIGPAYDAAFSKYKSATE